jgi:hypothetical protein
MKGIILAELAILVAASACGSAGAQTPDTGSAFAYSSRQQVKCYTKTMGSGVETGVEATCLGVDDLPLAGSCSNPDANPTVALSVNGPVAWEAPAATAAWDCGWLNANGLPVNVPRGTATICCVVKSQ